MVEPTETESRETLDAFADAMESIWAEVQATPSWCATPPIRCRLDARRGQSRAPAEIDLEGLANRGPFL